MKLLFIQDANAFNRHKKAPQERGFSSKLKTNYFLAALLAASAALTSAITTSATLLGHGM